MHRRIISSLWFVAVGITAAGVHLLTFDVIHRYLAPRLAPEIVNALSFLVAFTVSFAGHRLLSFPDTQLAVRQSLARFFGVAVGGFLINEAVFSTLLRRFDMAPRPALLVALLVAAGLTFVLSRYWAFRR